MIYCIYLKVKTPPHILSTHPPGTHNANEDLDATKKSGNTANIPQEQLYSASALVSTLDIVKWRFSGRLI